MDEEAAAEEENVESRKCVLEEEEEVHVLCASGASDWSRRNYVKT